jgi:hypothetical protein
MFNPRPTSGASQFGAADRAQRLQRVQQYQQGRQIPAAQPAVSTQSVQQPVSSMVSQPAMSTQQVQPISSSQASQPSVSIQSVQGQQFVRLSSSQSDSQSRYCTTLQKQNIIRVLDQFTPVSIQSEKLFFAPETQDKIRKRELLLHNILLCSKFGINNEKINQIIIYLCCTIKFDDIYKIVYRKTYRSPDIVPQQFFLFIKDKFEEVNKTHYIGDYHSQYTEVHYLADSVVGFKIHSDRVDLPPVEWKSTARINFS